MTDLHIQLRAAKVRLSRAAERCANPNDDGAPAEADAALAEVAAIQAQMSHARNQCTEPGCGRITLRGGKCDKHRPPAPVGPWAIAADVFRARR